MSSHSPILLVSFALLLPALVSCVGLRCPGFSRVTCPPNRPDLTYYDGCNVVTCVKQGVRDIWYESSDCRPPSSPSELAECEKLLKVFHLMQKGPSVDKALACTSKFSLETLCRYSRGAFPRTMAFNCKIYTCANGRPHLLGSNPTHECHRPESAADREYCDMNENSLIMSLSSGSCMNARALVNQVCDKAYNGFEFTDGCRKFECYDGSARQVGAGNCDVDPDESPRCQTIRDQLMELTTSDPPVRCDGTDKRDICVSKDTLGFVYHDGCGKVMCEASVTELVPGTSDKMCQRETSRTRDYCNGIRNTIRYRIENSKNFIECDDADRICARPGISYFNGCDYCTCVATGVAKCAKNKCHPKFGTSAEKRQFCTKNVYTL